MADPQADAERRRLVARLTRAAEELARGGDGVSMIPSNMRTVVEDWQRVVQRRGLTLDPERWLMGLLTLACLSDVAHPARLEPLS